jgi:hypothetical protein
MVITTHSGSAGTFLTTESGRAVYLWTADGMNKSSCSGACHRAANVPSLLDGRQHAAG